MNTLVTKARDVVCQGCGGTGGRHREVRCPFLVAALERATRKHSK